MAAFPFRDDEDIISGILTFQCIWSPRLFLLLITTQKGVTLGSTPAHARVQPGDILGESIYLQPSQNSHHTQIKPQQCLTIIIILRSFLLFSARLRLESARPRHDHCCWITAGKTKQNTHFSLFALSPAYPLRVCRGPSMGLQFSPLVMEDPDLEEAQRN